MLRPGVFHAVALVCLSLCGTGCSGSANASAAAKPSSAPAVTTIVAKTGAIHPVLQIAGLVTPYRQVGIAADLSEPISEVDVQEGDKVSAGQVLARLITDDLQAELVSDERLVAEDVARYSQTAYGTGAVNAQDASAIRSAEAVLHQVRVNLAGATRDLERYQALAVQGFLPEQTLDQQRTTVAGDAAAVNSAQAALDQAVAGAKANGRGNDPGEQQQELQAARAAADAAQASVEQLHREIARAVIVSPVDGIVDAVNANPGEYPTSRQLFTIEQLSSVYVLLPSSTAQVMQIQPGASASILVAGSARKYAGRVVAVLDQVQPGTTNFTVKVLVSNPGDRLRAGMPVNSSIALPVVSGIAIPLTAFVDDTHVAVYVVKNDVVASHEVHEVKDDGKTAIVTGLTAGTVLLANVESANVGNGDTVSTGPAKK